MSQVLFMQGINASSGGVCCHIVKGHMQIESQIPRLLGQGIGRTVHTGPSVMWYQTPTSIVTSQCPSSRDTDHVSHSLKSLKYVHLKRFKGVLPLWKLFKWNLSTSLKVMLSILTSMGHWISLKWCRWLAWRVCCHMPASVIHRVTWQQAYAF